MREGSINATQFVRYTAHEIRLGARIEHISDPRGDPEIQLPVLLMYFLYGSVTGLPSFNDMDLQARTVEFRRLLKISRRMVGSNSTFERVFRDLDVNQVAQLQRQLGHWARGKGHGTLRMPSGRRVRVAIVDGSVVSGEYYSVLDLPGRIDALIDVEPYTKGNELAASERVLRRLLDLEGVGFVDYVMGDSLYMTQGMLRLVRNEMKAHLLVKTKEAKTLNVVVAANLLFDAPRRLPQVQYVRGEDAERKVSYEIWAASIFQHQGIGPLSVARVVERSLKDPQAAPLGFWVITTNVQLSPHDMRFLGHERWSIENGGFKMLNALTHSKHQWVQKLRPRDSWSPQEKEQRSQEREIYHQVVVRLLMVAHLILQAFKESLDAEQIRREFGTVRITLVFLSQRLLMTIALVGEDMAVPPGV